MEFKDFKIKGGLKQFQDLGFGTKVTQHGKRLIRKDGSYNIERKGTGAWNTYQVLISMPGWQFALITILYFLVLNALFATSYLFVGIEQLRGVPSGSIFSDFFYAFFFSVQTLTTVGYGGIVPTGLSANFVASFEALVGLVTLALVTGLFFARFSRPRSQVAFSEHAVITTQDFSGFRFFQCRVVNKRNHKVVNLTGQIAMTWQEERKGKMRRRFYNFPLERSKISMFPLNWTISHKIKEESPLYGKSKKDLEEMKAEFLVMITGFDESYNQVIHANTSYFYDEVICDRRFVPMFETNEKGMTELDLDLLDKTSTT